MEKIVILGSGGLAKEIAFLIEEVNRIENKWEILGFIDKKNSNYNGKYKILNDDDWLINLNYPINVVVGIGNPVTNRNLIQKLVKNNHIQFPNIYHPNVIADWERIEMGKGNIVCAGNIFTTDIRIGSFNLFNLNGTVGHDAVVGDYNVLNPAANISGNVNMGSSILIGTGAQVLQNLTICDDVLIGAGAVVNKNIETPGTYVGIPARKI